MALRTRALATEAPYGLQERRLDLYRKAAPVFRAFGYLVDGGIVDRARFDEVFGAAY